MCFHAATRIPVSQVLPKRPRESERLWPLASLQCTGPATQRKAALGVRAAAVHVAQQRPPAPEQTRRRCAGTAGRHARQRTVSQGAPLSRRPCTLRKTSNQARQGGRHVGAGAAPRGRAPRGAGSHEPAPADVGHEAHEADQAQAERDRVDDPEAVRVVHEAARQDQVLAQDACAGRTPPLFVSLSLVLPLSLSLSLSLSLFPSLPLSCAVSRDSRFPRLCACSAPRSASRTPPGAQATECLCTGPHGPAQATSVHAAAAERARCLRTQPRAVPHWRARGLGTAARARQQARGAAVARRCGLGGGRVRAGARPRPGRTWPRRTWRT